jgi:hypothetical protein
MPKMTKSKMLCLIVAFACFVQLSIAAPVAESRSGNDVVDEIIQKLKQLKQQSEGNEWIIWKILWKFMWWWKIILMMEIYVGDGQKWWKTVYKSLTQIVFKNQGNQTTFDLLTIQIPIRKKSLEFTELLTISVADIYWSEAWAWTHWAVDTCWNEALTILPGELQWIPWAVDICCKLWNARI